jgi:cobalt-zinc-cadmium efflux system outer membrane protein
MRRNWVFWTCVLGIVASRFGVAGAEAQESAGVRPATAARDTLVITLAEVHRLALRQSPAFLAEAQETAVAGGQLRQARVYNLNPEFELRTPGAASGGLDQYELFLGQEIEWAGQRGARIAAARIGVERAQSAVQNSARRALGDVSQAFYRALAAQRRLSVARQLATLNQQLLTATRIQQREGEISTLEANLAEIEVGRANARVLAAERETSTALLELQRLTGIDPARDTRVAEEIAPAPPSLALNPDSLVALALARRPDLAAQTRALEQSRALTDLARREAIPNVRVGAIAEHDADGSSRVGVGISLPIPVWNRNQGTIVERQALTRQAELLRRATDLDVRTQVTTAVRAYRAASAERGVYEGDVLQPARQNQALLETAYRAGKIGLTTLLLVRNQLLDAEIGYWDAWLNERSALVDLEAATAAFPMDNLIESAAGGANP